MDFFMRLHPVLQGLLATLFTYAVTALGAALVFFIKKVNRTLIDLMLGFAAGVMIAACFWSLLQPSVELSLALGYNAWLINALGFLSGGAFVMLADLLMSKAKMFNSADSKFKRIALFAAAVTMHNIPEGLAVGVAFGSIPLGASATGAVMLALGIGLQNFPEGLCVSMPLYLSGKSKAKSFFAGQASGLVEPVAGVLGALFAVAAKSLLPLALSFSAGAMIAVVCAEIVPEAFEAGKRPAQIGILIGFTVMMILDIALG